MVNIDYEYDGYGNLSRQINYDMAVLPANQNITATQERFVYNQLHRLTESGRYQSSDINSSAIWGGGVINYNYNTLGNLTEKSDCGSSYQYASTKPHAVNQVSLHGRLGSRLALQHLLHTQQLQLA